MTPTSLRGQGSSKRAESGLAAREARIAAVDWRPPSDALEKVRTCNLCGNAQHIEVSRRDRYGFPSALKLCAECGLGFLSPRLTSSAYADFYREVYRPLVSAYHGRRIDAETLPTQQTDYARALVNFVREALSTSPRSVLDIGGSTGMVAGAVRDAFGSSATVLDPSEEELAVASEAGMETIRGMAESSADWRSRTWDLVLLCQTLDHLLDPGATLASVREALGDSGHAFVDILDFGAIMQRERSIEGAVKIDHPFYFTRSTARAYFDRTGLDVIAERPTSDGHHGYLLTAGNIREPEWGSLREERDSLLKLIRRVRAPRP